MNTNLQFHNFSHGSANTLKDPFSALKQRDRLFFVLNRSIVKYRTMIGQLFLSGSVKEGNILRASAVNWQNEL